MFFKNYSTFSLSLCSLFFTNDKYFTLADGSRVRAVVKRDR